MQAVRDPQSSRPRPQPRRASLLWVLVILPTALAIAYFGVLAHPVYVSEAHFILRNQQHPANGGLSGFLQSSGLSTADTDTYSVQEFLTSRDALQGLVRREQLEAAVRRPELDFIKRYPGWFYDGSFEDLWRYYRRHIVETELDTTSQIVTLTVRAYSAADAQRFNEALLVMSEELVNRMNERARQDLIRFAEADVAAAEAQVAGAVRAVSAYRNGETVYDPDKQSALQLGRVETVNQDLMAARKQLADIRSVAARSPQIPVLEARVRLLEDSLQAESARVAGGRRSLSSQSADFAAKALQQDFATKHLELALAALQQAREDARKQTLYLERIGEPNRPDVAVEPHRLRNVLATFLLSLIVFGIVRLLVAGVREHAE